MAESDTPNAAPRQAAALCTKSPHSAVAVQSLCFSSYCLLRVGCAVYNCEVQQSAAFLLTADHIAGAG